MALGLRPFFEEGSLKDEWMKPGDLNIKTHSDLFAVKGSFFHIKLQVELNG